MKPYLYWIKSQQKKKLGLPLNKKVIVFPNDPSREVKRYDLFLKTIDTLNRNDVYPHVIYGIGHSELVEHLIASDILLFTSKHEGSPNIIKEALALNLPIVSVNVGDVMERVSGIDGCFVVEQDSPQILSVALQKALEFNYQNYNSRTSVENLSENVLVEKLISVYKQYVHI